MSVLIIAEHDNKQLNPATLHAVAAAAKLGKVDLLVVGNGASSVVEFAKQVAGVEKVLVADAAHYAEGLAEELAAGCQIGGGLPLCCSNGNHIR